MIYINSCLVPVAGKQRCLTGSCDKEIIFYDTDGNKLGQKRVMGYVEDIGIRTLSDLVEN